MNTTIPGSPGAPGLHFLDELLASGELWSGREDEAEKLAAHLLDAQSPIIVLHGPSRSGKTEIVRREVMPRLGAHRPVWFRGDATRLEGQAPAGDGIEFWDSFESALADEADLPGVVAELTAARDRGRGCRLVLVIADDALSRLFQLCAAIPEIVDDVIEIPRIATRPMLDRLVATTVRYGVSISDSFLAALSRDLGAAGAAAGSELAAILVFEICRMRPARSQADGEYYQSRGGLEGLLESHLNCVLEHGPQGIDSQIGWAVLAEVASASSPSPDLTEIATRFEVPAGIPDLMLEWLSETRRIVRRSGTGEYELVPPQLAVAVRARRQRDAVAEEHHRAVLLQMSRNLMDAQALLSEQTFRRIHSQRTVLKVNAEEAQLLLRCALAYEAAGLEGATGYWLRRVRDPDQQVDALLEALFDTRAEVRRLAAVHLAVFRRADVRNQLHLLALRDPDEGVRAAAIDSLDAMKDDELLASLAQELRERTSPYRLRAIDALRIFDTPGATTALLQIVATNETGQDLDARHRAIDVLGRQQSPEAVDALLEVAVRDADPEDRQRAAQALASTRSEDTLRLVVDRLRELTAEAKKWHLSWSWRAIASRLGYTVLAALVVAASLLIHGLVLITMGRWRLGLAISAAGLTGFFFAGDPSTLVAGSVAAAAAALAGLLTAFHFLVAERLLHAPAPAYRRSLGPVVFAACLVPFVYLHGLPSMLARNFKRGLRLLLFEALGIVVLAGAVYTWDEFGAYASLSQVFAWTGVSAFAVGWALVTCTFVIGIGSVWLEAFGFERRRQQLLRLDDLQEALAANPLLPVLLLRDCTQGGRREAGSARRTFRRFGRKMRDGLRACWEGADDASRRTIFTVLVRRHDPESMEFLRGAVKTLDRRARLEFAWANVAFRIALLPKPLIGAFVIVLYIQVAALAVFYTQRALQPATLEATAGGAGTIEEQVEAIRRLRTLAEQPVSVDVASVAARSLGNVATAPGFANQDPAVQVAALEAIAAAGAEERQLLADAVAGRLADPALQPQAIATLKAITSDAMRRVRTFVEEPLPPRGETDQVATKRRAIEAMAASGELDALESLVALSRNDTLRAELRDAARDAVSSFDPLQRAESAIERGEYRVAIAQAEGVLAGPARDAAAAGAHDVLARAHTYEGHAALNEQRFADAKASLLAAIQHAPAGGSGAGLVVTLGLSVAYAYHEDVAPSDPSGYQEVYDVLTRLRAYGGDPALATSVAANLAEASLTTGRYAEAVRLAREIAARQDSAANVVLPMRFIAYAATVLDGQPAESARQELLAYYNQQPSGFANDWVFGGTRAYIERAPVAASRKTPLLEALTRIEQPK